ncbi:MAG: sialidase family protein, partial [Acidimicrobiales bacterium]
MGRRTRGVGRVLLAAVLLGAPALVGPAAGAADVPLTTKTAATDAYQNPSLAVDPGNPRRVAAAYFEGSRLDRCYLGLSNDGGATWQTRLLLGAGGQYPLPNPATGWCLNPEVAYGPGGILYYVAQAALPNGRVGDQAKLYASEDGGRSFRGPTTLDPGQTAMRGYWPAVAVDARSGRVYVAWSQHPGPPAPGRVLISASDDKGASFSPPVFISPPDQVFPAAPQVSVGPDGRVYVVYASEIDNTIHAAVSDDGARSFAPPVKIDDLVPSRVFGNGPPVVNSLYGSFGQRYSAMVAGPQPGRAALSFWDTRGPAKLGRVSISTTADGGRSWSPPKVVAVPAGREGDHQLNSWMTGAPGGRLDLAFYVRSGVEGPQDVYLASSTDGGASFAAPRKLNDAPSSSTIGPPGFFTDNVRIGDFVGVASLDAGALVSWVDTRRGNVDDGHQDIFFATTVPPSLGYRLVAADGGVFGFGDAGYFGSTGGLELRRPVVAAAGTPSGKGYWLVGADGGVFGFGDAVFHGGLSALELRRPVVAMAATPTGKGYWMTAADGGVFAFGDARARGNLVELALTLPVVAMAATPSGEGYWVGAGDGGVFAFGDADFLGSTGAIRLNQHIVAMATTVTGKGYWLTAADGGVFAFGDAGFYGSTGGLRLN